MKQTDFRVDISREEVLSPAMVNIWDRFGQGVVVVDANGICCYMNKLQKNIDGYTHINIIGVHISELYRAHERSIIPTLECLRGQKPLLKKVYWYKTRKNQIFNSINDFFPLFNKGKIDGVISFTTNVGSNTVGYGEKTYQVDMYQEDISLYTFDDFIGNNEKLQHAISIARLAVSSDVPVIIWGESGTGKELFAQSIHTHSNRCHKPFIPINCAAIPENLLEGMIFGTTKGAFTDSSEKAGLLEEAHGGTILFDELNSMPLGLQAKLLRALQERQARRLGARTEYRFDVRFISILNECPLHCIEQGHLRSDLYYRLAVVGIDVPPLRERKDDILLLANHFIMNSKFLNKNVKISVGSDVVSMLYAYDWPGNIRELQHVIEGSLALIGGENCIHYHNLPLHFHEAFTRQLKVNPINTKERQDIVSRDGLQQYCYEDMQNGATIPLKRLLRDYESQCIKSVLKVTGGNVAKAARILEMKVSSLHYSIKNLGI